MLTSFINRISGINELVVIGSAISKWGEFYITTYKNMTNYDRKIAIISNTELSEMRIIEYIALSVCTNCQNIGKKCTCEKSKLFTSDNLIHILVRLPEISVTQQKNNTKFLVRIKLAEVVELPNFDLYSVYDMILIQRDVDIKCGDANLQFHSKLLEVRGGKYFKNCTKKNYEFNHEHTVLMEYHNYLYHDTINASDEEYVKIYKFAEEIKCNRLMMICRNKLLLNKNLSCLIAINHV